MEENYDARLQNLTSEVDKVSTEKKISFSLASQESHQSFRLRKRKQVFLSNHSNGLADIFAEMASRLDSDTPTYFNTSQS